MEKINLIELLEDCPKGTKLYSPLFGELKFAGISHTLILCQDVYRELVSFESDGKYIPKYHQAECMLFPSKDQRDWSKFQRPFKDGDIVVYDTYRGGIQLFIFKEKEKEEDDELGNLLSICYCYLMLDTNGDLDLNVGKYYVTRLATEEEKQKLFDAIKAIGFEWNAETKTLEKLVQPIFEVGNKIEKCGYRFTIAEVKDDYYLTKCGNKIPFGNQDGFSLAPNKFDITTLKPFDKVLVRDSNKQKWTIDFFSFIDKSQMSPFICSGHYTYQCIPYEKNEHLLGTTNDCDEFYKTW